MNLEPINFFSNVLWPNRVCSGMYGNNISTDENGSYSAAEAVCKGVAAEGLGGQREVYPHHTWVSIKEEVLRQVEIEGDRLQLTLYEVSMGFDDTPTDFTISFGVKTDAEAFVEQVKEGGIYNAVCNERKIIVPKEPVQLQRTVDRVVDNVVFIHDLIFKEISDLERGIDVTLLSVEEAHYEANKKLFEALEGKTKDKEIGGMILHSTEIGGMTFHSMLSRLEYLKKQTQKNNFISHSISNIRIEYDGIFKAYRLRATLKLSSDGTNPGRAALLSNIERGSNLVLCSRNLVTYMGFSRFKVVDVVSWDIVCSIV